MSKLILFDFHCVSCEKVFEELVEPHVKNVPCPKCGWEATRQVSLGHLAYRRMGVSSDFPTAAAKWEKMQRRKTKVDKGGLADGAPNLKMY